MQLLTAYLSDRLFTPRQRKSMQVFVDLTREAVRVPVTRAMLMPRRLGLRTIAPSSFEMTVSTAVGIRDAGEVLAHEMIHISQVMNGRLVLNRATKKVNDTKATVDLARWMSGKPVIIDQLEWCHRPWEIEACYWQTILVDEFLTLAGGNQPVQQLQKTGKKHLALFKVALPVSQVVRANPEPQADDAPADMTPATPHPGAPADMNMPQLDGTAALDLNLNGPDLNGSGANGAQINGSCLNGSPANGSGTNGHHSDTSILASDDVMQIIVPGLESPRPLHLDSLVAKRQDLQQRGLLNDEAVAGADVLTGRIRL